MKRYIQAHEQESVDFEQEHIVLDAQQFTATTLNEVGYLCWDQLKEARSIRELTDVITKQYHVPDAIVIADVTAFLRKMMESGLIRDAGE